MIDLLSNLFESPAVTACEWSGWEKSYLWNSKIPVYEKRVCSCGQMIEIRSWGTPR